MLLVSILKLKLFKRNNGNLVFKVFFIDKVSWFINFVFVFGGL